MGLNTHRPHQPFGSAQVLLLRPRGACPSSFSPRSLELHQGLFEVLHSAGGVVGVEEAKGVVRELGSVGQLVVVVQWR